MIERIYPTEMIRPFLLIDLIALVFLAYHIFSINTLGLPGSLALFGTFLLAYYISLWHKDWKLPFATLLGCGVLTVSAIYYHEWLLLYGFIFADLSGRSRSRINMFIGSTLIVGMYIVTYTALTGKVYGFATGVQLPFLVLQMLYPFVISIREHSKFLKQELRQANEKIERLIQEKERNRIARDLHDTLGQTLTMITLKCELTKRLIDKDTERAKRELDETMKTSRYALKQVRELVTAMKHVSIQDELQQAADLMQTAGIDLHITADDLQPQLLKSVETMVALCMREAFTNIVKHSRAKHCLVTLKQEQHQFLVIIHDDGVGLKTTENWGNGIASMVERMNSINGSASIAETGEKGVTITLSLPLAHNYSPAS